MTDLSTVPISVLLDRCDELAEAASKLRALGCDDDATNVMSAHQVFHAAVRAQARKIDAEKAKQKKEMDDRIHARYNYSMDEDFDYFFKQAKSRK